MPICHVDENRALAFRLRRRLSSREPRWAELERRRINNGIIEQCVCSGSDIAEDKRNLSTGSFNRNESFDRLDRIPTR